MLLLRIKGGLVLFADHVDLSISLQQCPLTSRQPAVARERARVSDSFGGDILKIDYDRQRVPQWFQGSTDTIDHSLAAPALPVNHDNKVAAIHPHDRSHAFELGDCGPSAFRVDRPSRDGNPSSAHEFMGHRIHVLLGRT